MAQIGLYIAFNASFSFLILRKTRFAGVWICFRSRNVRQPENGLTARMRCAWYEGPLSRNGPYFANPTLRGADIPPVSHSAKVRSECAPYGMLR